MFRRSTNPVARAGVRYIAWLFVALVAYTALIATRERVLPHMRDGSVLAQNLVALSPLLPVMVIFAAVVRLLRNMDELGRRVFVAAIAIAGAVAAMTNMGLGLMESDYCPPFSAWWGFSVFGATWLVASGILALRYAR